MVRRCVRARRLLARFAGAMGVLALSACASDAQEQSTLVVSTERELARMAASLLPDLAHRSGMELRAPVRIERRSRSELERYLRHKLDQDLPDEKARQVVAAYALLGLVPDTLELRELLLSLYTEQVAGFYDPDSTALFILDDQPASAVEPLLIHELVHAVQDQSVDLASLTHPSVGNDRGRAAQAAIEGHATLVMLEFLTERMRGEPVDLSTVQDFSGTLRPALQGLVGQFPALAGAPPVMREALLFPYVEGAAYVQDLWRRVGRETPLGTHLPLSTEQVLTGDASDAPLTVTLQVEGGISAYENDLGQLELGVLLETHVGPSGRELARGWGGDRFTLVDLPGGERGLALAVAWDDAPSRDAFVEGLAPHLGLLPRRATLEAIEAGTHPVALLRVGLPDRLRVGVGVGP